MHIIKVSFCIPTLFPTSFVYLTRPGESIIMIWVNELEWVDNTHLHMKNISASLLFEII